MALWVLRVTRDLPDYSIAAGDLFLAKGIGWEGDVYALLYSLKSADDPGIAVAPEDVALLDLFREGRL